VSPTLFFFRLRNYHVKKTVTKGVRVENYFPLESLVETVYVHCVRRQSRRKNEVIRGDREDME
jgi:hypothetical protein